MHCSILRFHPESGEIKGGETKKVHPCQPIPIALTIIALAAVALGIASLGVQQQWWTAGALSNLSQPGLITLMSTGGAGLALLAALAVANCRKPGLPEEEEVSPVEPEEQPSPTAEIGILKGTDQAIAALFDGRGDKWFTFCPCTNGHFALMFKADNKVLQSKIFLKVEAEKWVEANDIPPGELQAARNYFEGSHIGWIFLEHQALAFARAQSEEE